MGRGPTAVLKLLEERKMYGVRAGHASRQRTEWTFERGESTLYPASYMIWRPGISFAVR